ncbi:MAG: formimidoylglutamate deiminase [Planctomycetota bacterium]
MPGLSARHVFLGDRWVGPVRFEWGADGRVSAVEELDASASCDAEFVIPGLPNLHSHAFQRAFAGRAERVAAEGQGSFWTWREAMYGFVDRLTPEHVEAIASMGQMEMLESGFTSVGEFHYLHHDPAGEAHEDVAEMAARVLTAARSTGIRMTLLPVLYLHGGFGRELQSEQRRFGHASVDEFLDLFLRCRELVDESGVDDVVGIAPHSLRAVRLEELVDVVGAARGLDDGAPIHIHIAEQQLEVRDCVEAIGKRPVRALLDSIEVDAATCLVHATHLDSDERVALAESGAVAGLCPTTEANLGDGIFPLVEYLREGGAIGVGTDSHISIDIRSEISMLEYGQRLRDESRATVGEAGSSVGTTLYGSCLRGGASSLALGPAGIVVGAAADFVVLDSEHPRLLGHREETVLDAYLFSQAGAPPVDRVFVRGQEVVSGGRHRERDAISARFVATLEGLR